MSYLTENLFYQIEKYNSTDTQQLALQSDNLLAPIVQNSSNWSVAINKANLPISTIPLTADNIGLRKYAVTLADGNHSNTTYVSQVGSTNTNYIWDSEGTTIYQRSYTASGAITDITSVNYGPICGIVSITKFLVDDFKNVYLCGPTSPSGLPGTLYVVGSNQQILVTLAFNNIVDLYIDRGQKLYVSDAGEIQAVSIFSNVNAVNSVTLNPVAEITTGFGGIPITGLVFAVGGDNVIIIGHSGNLLSFYNQTTFEPISNITGPAGLLTSGTVLDSAAVYALGYVDTPLDALYGTVSNESVYNAFNGSQLITEGIPASAPISKYTVGATVNTPSSLNGYIIGEDGHLYTQAYNPTTSQSVYNAISGSQPSFNSLVSNKSQVVGLQTNGVLSFFNQRYGPLTTIETPIWSPAFNDFQIAAPNDIIDFDFNHVTNRVIAVDSTNGVHISDVAVTPNMYVVVSEDQSSISLYGVSNFDQSTTSNVAQLLRLISVNTCTQALYRYIDNLIYSVEGSAGSQKVYARSAIDGSIVRTYDCSNNAGYITRFELGTNAIVCADNATNTTIWQYDLTSGDMTGSVVIDDTGVVASCTLTTYSLLAFATPGKLVIVQSTADPALNLVYSDSVVLPARGAITLLTGSSTDVVNALPTIFVYTTDATNGFILGQYSFGVDFASIQLVQNVQIWDPTSDPGLVQLNYINNDFQLVQSTSSLSTIYYQTSPTTPYNNAPAYTTTFSISNLGSGDIPQFVSGAFINWQTLTVTGGDILCSVAVSRYNPTLGYAIVGVSSGNIYPISIDYSNSVIKVGTTPVSGANYNKVSTFKNGAQVVTSKAATYNVSSQSLVGSVSYPGVGPFTTIAKNEIDQTFGLIQTANSKLLILDTGLAVVSQSVNSGFGVASCFDIRNGEDIDSGPVSIYDMQVLIDQINLAFVDCFKRLQSKGTTLTSAPVLTLDFQSGLLTLKYDSSYIAKDCYIAFNTNLLTICYFTNVSGKIVLNPAATSITQNSKSVFNFNDLQSVQFRSNNIFVNGQYYSTNLSSSRIICEIDPDTTTYVNNLGQRLYYNPTILRSFFLQSTLPLQIISIQLYYTTKQGKEYPIYLNPSDFFTTKLNFIRKY